MARFTYSKTVENYSFNPPTMISEQEFNQLKSQIRQNPNAPLINENAVQNSHEKLTTILLFGVIALVIGLFGMFAFETPQWWGVLLTLLSVFGVLHPIVNMGQLESSRNRLAVEQKRINYFRELKTMIENCPDYSVFKLKYELKYGVLMRGF
jgi:hypothetical protein